MSNYYEALGVAADTSVAELQSAWDSRYTELRRLVTHHDPTVVNQANQALQTLESIRATLLDPSARAAYDAGLGLGNVGGLADLDALVSTPLTMPTPASAAKPQESKGPRVPRTDAWVCPKCHNANAVGLQFCAECGERIGSSCPSCAKTIFVGAPYCPHCGADVNIVRREKEQAEESAQQAATRQKLQALQAQVRQERADMASLEKKSQQSIQLRGLVYVGLVPNREWFVGVLFLLGGFFAVGLSSDTCGSVSFFLGLGVFVAWMAWRGTVCSRAVAAAELSERQLRVRALEREIEQIKRSPA